MNKFEGIKAPSKIPTGIDGFEHISLGGLPEGRTTLIFGSSGSGKTIFLSQLIYFSVTKFDRPCVFVTLEEHAVDIVRNVKRLGWNLDELVDEGKLHLLDASPDSDETITSGEFDLSGFLVRVEAAVKKIGAVMVGIDSIGAIFERYGDTHVIRRDLFRLSERLKEMGVTTIITGERTDEYGGISRHGVEEFVSDNVVILRNVLDNEKCRRTVQILKLRGDIHNKGEFPFSITDSGISIIPVSNVELKQSSSTERVSVGNDVLDKMTSGGFFRDSIILVSGPTGGGKTLMSTMFTKEACRSGERVLLLAYEESRPQLMRNAESWGVDFNKLEEDGLLRIVCLYPEAMGLEDHLLQIHKQIGEFRPQRMVMDSVSAMERVASIRTFREFVIGVTSFAKQENICSLFTATTPKLSGGESITEAHISTITDAIILLRYVEINGVLRRGIAVIKMRGSQHDKEIREFTIDAEGLSVGEPLKNVSNIILGHPSVMTSEGDQLEGMF